MPGEQCLRRDDRSDLPQNPAANSLCLGSQPAPLVVVEPQPPVTDQFAKNSNLLAKVLDGILLLIHRAGDTDQHEAKRGPERWWFLWAMPILDVWAVPAKVVFYQRDRVFGHYELLLSKT